MIDIAALKNALPDPIPLLSGMQKKTADEWGGPCPKCGGTDRFQLWPASGKFWCRQCKWMGDTIDLFCHLNGTDKRGLAAAYGPANHEPVRPQLPKPETAKRTPSKPFVHFQLGEPVEKYAYTDERGEVLFYSCRFEPKAFRQCTPDGLTWKVQGLRQVPYHLEKLLSSTGLVLICEGEKDVHSAELMGFVATTNAGGAGSWTDEYSKYLAGRDVVIVSDDDEAGRARNRKVALSLARVGGKND